MNRESVTTRQTQSSLFDMEQALYSLGGDRPLLMEMAAIFVREAPSLIGELRHAIEQNDTLSVAESAHSIKGAMAVFCATRPLVTARQLEAAAKLGDLPLCRQEFIRLDAQLEGMLLGMQQLLGIEQTRIA
jgi:HPt (histidine-containing phosphotransfer) domain-containing protein